MKTAVPLLAICLCLSACHHVPTEDVLAAPDPLLSRVPVAVDVAAFDEMIQHATARNNAAKEVMVGDGRLFRVPVPVRVQVLGGGLATEIRILDGAFAGRTGYVPCEWVQSRPLVASSAP